MIKLYEQFLVGDIWGKEMIHVRRNTHKEIVSVARAGHNGRQVYRTEVLDNRTSVVIMGFYRTYEPPF
jgi:hypothetical protein